MNYTDKLNDTAVLWDDPVAVGDGSYTYDTAVEIDCRWEQRRELYINREGREEVSNAIVYVNQDIARGAYLYLGEETDLDSDHSDPETIEDAWIVKRFDKISSVDGSLYVRKVVL